MCASQKLCSAEFSHLEAALIAQSRGLRHPVGWQAVPQKTAHLLAVCHVTFV